MEKLQEQLLDYNVACEAAAKMYADKSDKIDSAGFQGTKNLSPEGVGGILAIGGIAGKLAYAGARLIECTANVSQEYSAILDSAALPLNLVAGLAIAAGTSIVVGNVIKDAISSKLSNKSADISDLGSYAIEAYRAIQNGEIVLPMGATIADAVAAVREKQISDYIAEGGEMEDVESVFPNLDFGKVNGLVNKARDKDPEKFDEYKAQAVEVQRNNLEIEASFVQ